MDEAKVLVDELKRLLRLIAVFGLNGKPQREQIRLLTVAGFAPKEIAAMIGTTANTVRVALTAIRKEVRPKIKRRKKP